jgi:PII-like signaling protein
MESVMAVTMVRVYLPEASHTTRKTQMEKVVHLLREQLHVHGVTVLTGLREAGTGTEAHAESVGDILRRNPDPPAIIEFFDESRAVAEITRQIRQLVPNSYAVHWQATCENIAPRVAA